MTLNDGLMVQLNSLSDERPGVRKLHLYFTGRILNYNPL